MTNQLTSILRVGAITGAALACQTVALGQSAPTLTESVKWETSASLGFTLTSGNSDTLLATADITSTRKWDKNELTAAAGLTYGENSGAKNSDSQHISLQYNRLLTGKWFAYARAEWMRDSIADIDYRVTISPGVGYYFWKDAKKGFLRAELGPGYVFEKKGNVSDDYFTIRVAERFEYKFTDSAKMWQSLEFTPDVGDFDNYQAVAEIGVDVTIAKNTGLRAYLQDVFNNNPAAGRDKNDLKLVTALSYKF
jgi:putative salt-induced outer membrane protein YdiY